MSALAVSANVVQRELLEPAMEATAFSRVLSRLLYDPSPEPDSVIELLLVGMVDRGAQPWEIEAVKLCQEALHVNARGGDEVRSISGVVDEWARILHGAELAGDQPAGLSIKQLAAAVRAPLGVLQAAGGDALALVDAVRAIDAVTAWCARERLASSALRNELRPRKHDLLLEIFDRRSAS